MYKACNWYSKALPQITMALIKAMPTIIVSIVEALFSAMPILLDGFIAIFGGGIYVEFTPIIDFFGLFIML